MPPDLVPNMFEPIALGELAAALQVPEPAILAAAQRLEASDGAGRYRTIALRDVPLVRAALSEMGCFTRRGKGG